MNALNVSGNGLHVVNQFRFPSSTTDQTYTVIQWDDGRLSCNCKGWTFKKKGCPVRYCKHTFQVMCDLMKQGVRVLTIATPEQEQAMMQHSKRAINLDDD